MYNLRWPLMFVIHSYSIRSFQLLIVGLTIKYPLNLGPNINFIQAFIEDNTIVNDAIKLGIKFSSILNRINSFWFCSSLADGRLPVRTADVVKLDSVVVDVVEHGQTGLLTSTVGLGLTLDPSVGPGKAPGGDGLGTTVGPLESVAETKRSQVDLMSC